MVVARTAWRACPACGSVNISARFSGSLAALTCRDCAHHWQQRDRRAQASTGRVTAAERLAVGGIIWRASRESETAECALRRLLPNLHWVLEVRVGTSERVIEQFVDSVDGMTQGSRHLARLLHEGWTEVE